MLWVGLLCSFASTGLFPWQIVLEIPLLGTMLMSIQFAYRLLSIGETALCFLAVITLILWLKDQKIRRTAGVMLAGAAVVLSGMLYEFGIKTQHR